MIREAHSYCVTVKYLSCSIRSDRCLDLCCLFLHEDQPLKVLKILAKKNIFEKRHFCTTLACQGTRVFGEIL